MWERSQEEVGGGGWEGLTQSCSPSMQGLALALDPGGFTILMAARSKKNTVS
jgi:hypothetical protein